MMVKRVATAPRAAKAPHAKEVPQSRVAKWAAPADQSRLDKLIALIDRCTEAKAIAEGVNAPFLAYLLAMAIQEARTELRGTEH